MSSLNQYAAYDSEGRVHYTVQTSTVDSEFTESTGLLLAPCPYDLDDSTAYVDNGQVVPKQPFGLHLDKPQIVADGSDLATISNVPAGTTLVWHDGQVNEISDGIVQLDTDLPGTYVLKFSAIAYLDQEVTIEAVPAA